MALFPLLTRQHLAYEEAGFFSVKKKDIPQATPSCSLTIGCTLSGGLFLGVYSLTVIALLTASITPWLLLFAAPYFLLGAGLGYELAQSLPSPTPTSFPSMSNR